MNASGSEREATLLQRDGWKLKLPASPLVLDDTRLMQYRHPNERWMLAVSIAVIASLAASLLFSDRDVLIAIAAVYVSMLMTSIQAKTYYRMQGAEVTPTQFATIFTLAEELRERLQAPPTRIFVVRRLGFAAEAFGLKAPYVIVLPDRAIDALEPEELRYVLGQAFGHICYGHTRVAVLIGGEESSLPAVLSWVAWARDLIFAGYWRVATASADRAAILACGGVANAIRAQVKISVGTNQFDEIRADALLEQAFKVSEGMTRFQSTLIRWRSSTPPLIPRLEEMVAWAGLPSRQESTASGGGKHRPIVAPSQPAGDPPA